MDPWIHQEVSPVMGITVSVCQTFFFLYFPNIPGGSSKRFALGRSGQQQIENDWDDWDDTA